MNAPADMPVDVLSYHDALIEHGAPAWLADAVSDACGTGDLKFLRKQVERHVPGWVTP